MKKLLLISAALTISFGLTGCHTANNAVDGTTKVVGTGFKYTATAVGAGVGVVSKTGAAIGTGVGTIVNTGVGFVDGHPVKYQKSHAKAQMVKRNGHNYMLQNGKYVRVQ